MIMLVAALLGMQPQDDTAIQAQAWARKAKPFETCSAGQDCDQKWARAAAWIRDNTRFKIAVDEPNLLSTPGAIYANTDLSFTMTKTARDDGRFDLNVFAWCGNVIACHPKPKDATARLARVVEGQ